MDKEEYAFSQTIVGNRCLVCEAKDEAIEDLIDENKRLRNRIKILTAVKTQLRRKVEDLMKDSDIKFEALCNSVPEEFLSDQF